MSWLPQSRRGFCLIRLGQGQGLSDRKFSTERFPHVYLRGISRLKSFPQAEAHQWPSGRLSCFVTNRSWLRVRRFPIRNMKVKSRRGRESWKNFLYRANPTRELIQFEPIGRPKYSTSERLVKIGIRKNKCTHQTVQVVDAGELAGSSFSRVGVAFLRVQAPAAKPSVSASYLTACLRMVACLLTEVQSKKKAALVQRSRILRGACEAYPQK